MSEAVTSSTLRILQQGLERAGWDLVSVEIDLAKETARIELRQDARIVIFDARNGRASTTREVLARRQEPMGRRGDRFISERLSTEFLGRDRHECVHTGLRFLADYLSDNSTGMLTKASVHELFLPLLPKKLSDGQ